MKVIHNECGGVAFFYAGTPKRGDVIRSDLATYPDGTQPVDGSPLMCGSCHRQIMTIDKATFDLRLEN